LRDTVEERALKESSVRITEARLTYRWVKEDHDVEGETIKVEDESKPNPPSSKRRLTHLLLYGIAALIFVAIGGASEQTWLFVIGILLLLVIPAFIFSLLIPSTAAAILVWSFTPPQECPYCGHLVREPLWGDLKCWYCQRPLKFINGIPFLIAENTRNTSASN